MKKYLATLTALTATVFTAAAFAADGPGFYSNAFYTIGTQSVQSSATSYTRSYTTIPRAEYDVFDALNDWTGIFSCAGTSFSGLEASAVPPVTENFVTHVPNLSGYPAGVDGTVAVTVFSGGLQPPQHTPSTRAQIFVNQQNYNYYISWPDASGNPIYPTTHPVTRVTIPYVGGRDLYTIVSHEIGHVLGVGHDTMAGSLMNIGLASGLNWRARDRWTQTAQQSARERAQGAYGCTP